LTQFCISPIQPVVPAVPTVAQQRQQCQDRYTQSKLSLEQTTQSKRTYYNNLISQIPSAEYLAEHGLTFSSIASQAAQDRSDALAGLAKVEADYNASLANLNSVLQDCLSVVE